VIGINGYTEMNPLEGCVADSEEIKDYLTRYLFVPPEHIVVLQDKYASRSKILSTLYDHLRDNSSIVSKDNIVISFSGHGTSYDASTEFRSIPGGTGTIEALCPIDRGTKDATGNIIPDISDREINIILQEISLLRSRNITVILDCCYAGGATRSPTIEPIKEPLPPLELGLKLMLEAADSDPRRVSATKAFTEGWEADMSNHVVLASCQNHEIAHEWCDQKLNRTQGLFSKKVLEVLKSKESMSATYVDVINAVGPLGRGRRQQTPVAAGARRGCRLWFQSKM
jgi:hypothetical protein